MTDLLNLWAMANASPLGIRIKTDDPNLLRQQLYRARADAGLYKDLGIVLPSTPNQLWIVRQDADERGRFDTIHSQPVLEGPRVPSKEGGEPEHQQHDPEDNPESGEGDAR